MSCIGVPRLTVHREVFYAPFWPEWKSSQSITPRSSVWSDILIGCQWHHGNSWLLEKTKGKMRKMISQVSLWFRKHSWKQRPWPRHSVPLHSLSGVSVSQCVPDPELRHFMLVAWVGVFVKREISKYQKPDSVSLKNSPAIPWLYPQWPNIRVWKAYSRDLFCRQMDD